MGDILVVYRPRCDYSSLIISLSYQPDVSVLSVIHFTDLENIYGALCLALVSYSSIWTAACVCSNKQH